MQVRLILSPCHEHVFVFLRLPFRGCLLLYLTIEYIMLSKIREVTQGIIKINTNWHLKVVRRGLLSRIKS